MQAEETKWNPERGRHAPIAASSMKKVQAGKKPKQARMTGKSFDLTQAHYFTTGAKIANT